jgi:hypothetical protein
MSTKEALEALIGGQAFEFRSKIEDELAARSLEAIQTKRFEVGASMFEEEENVEESLSPDAKQQRYSDIKKAALSSKKNQALKSAENKAAARAKKDIVDEED